MRNLKDFMYSTSTKNTLSVISKLKVLITEQPEVDINDILGRFTLDTFCEIAFGVNINAVESYPESHAFGVAFDELVNRVDWRAGDIIWKLKRALNGGNEAVMARDARIVTDFVNGILDQKLRGETKSNITDSDSKEQHNLLSLFLKQNDSLSREELKDITLNFIVGFRLQNRNQIPL